IGRSNVGRIRPKAVMRRPPAKRRNTLRYCALRTPVRRIISETARQGVVRARKAAGARGRAAVAGGLIKHAVAPRGLGKSRRVGVLRHLEGVEAGAQHEQELVAQHLAGGAQFAAEAVAFADQPRLAEGAAVLEAG